MFRLNPRDVFMYRLYTLFYQSRISSISVLASTRENGILHFLHTRGTIYCWETGVHTSAFIEVLLQLKLHWGQSLQLTKTFYRVFLCSSHVGFVLVSNLLDIYCSIWRGVFLSKFLFVTDPKPKFGLRVFGGPRSPKTFHVLGDPKTFMKTL